MNDLSNSLCLTLLYFLSYFLSGYYPLKYDEFVKRGIKNNFLCKVAEYSKGKYTSYLILVVTVAALLLAGTGIGYSFYKTAELNTTAYWIYNLDIFGRFYYCLLLGVTWYHSLSLLVMALTSGFVVYLTIESGYIEYIDEDFDKNASIMSAVDIVISTFSYGLFYIIGSFLFIFNDKLALMYEVKNTFYDDSNALILVLSVSLLVIFAYLPLRKLLLFMKTKKEKLIENLNERISKEEKNNKKEKMRLERNELIKQKLIYTTITNKTIFIFSVLIPSVGVVFQGIDLLNI